MQWAVTSGKLVAECTTCSHAHGVSSQLNVDYRGATNWNQLPNELRVIQTCNQFKSKQKSLLQNMPI